MYAQLNDVLTVDERARLDAMLAGARFEDGASTAGAAARRVKHNQQVSQSDEATSPARALVMEALVRHETFRNHAMPLRMMPIVFSRYEPGMTYGDHTDNAIMGRDPVVRTDLAVTVFLSSPESYDGGELMIGVDGDPRPVKLRAGSAVVYDATSLHRVEPVTRGVRLAAVTWIQSLVRNSAQRELLADISIALNWLREVAPASPQTLKLAKARANLVRMWSDL